MCATGTSNANTDAGMGVWATGEGGDVEVLLQLAGSKAGESHRATASAGGPFIGGERVEERCAEPAGEVVFLLGPVHAEP